MNEKIESTVTVNIGGVYYSTSRSTLCADKNSMLTAMFSGLHKVETLRDGSYFIDANGKHFGIILDYLRGRIMYSDDLPADKETLQELRREVDFYNLLDLKDLIDVSLKRFPSNFSEWISSYFDKRTFNPVSYESKKYVVFRKFNGCHCKFENVIFSHKANFERANLIKTKFHGCKFLQDITFRGACLENAEFYNCDFADNVKITFDEANLYKCSFTCSLKSRSKYTFELKQAGGGHGYAVMLSFAQCIDKMSFCNAKNIDQAHFLEGKLELIQNILRT